MKTQYRVLSYDGYRGAERPRFIVTGNVTLRVTEVESASVTAGVDEDSPEIRRFRVRCENGKRFEAIYAEETGWEVRPL